MTSPDAANPPEPDRSTPRESAGVTREASDDVRHPAEEHLVHPAPSTCLGLLAELQATATEVLGVGRQLLSQGQQRCACGGDDADLRALLVSTAARNRELEEHFFEREVMDGLCHTLISFADRAREVCASVKRRVDRWRSSPTARACPTCSKLSVYLKLHGRDVQATLTTLGVEAYTDPSEQFDPAAQHCVAAIAAIEPQLHGTIARRIAPGYRRNGRILRREQVHVFTAVAPKAPTKQEVAEQVTPLPVLCALAEPSASALSQL